MSLLLPDGLLVLSLLFVRPASDRDWPRRLALHTLLLSGCLLAAATAGQGGRAGEGRCLVGLAASLLQLAVLVVLLRRGGAGIAWQHRPGEAGWLLAGLALVALTAWIVPGIGMPRGLLTVCVSATLTGLLGAAGARSTVGGTYAVGGTYTVGGTGSLLLAGDALVLAACLLPGTGGLALATILLFQAACLCVLVRIRATAPAGS